MVTFSLWGLLVIYAIFVAIFFIYAVIVIYHLISYGFLSFESFFMTFLFIASVILILFVTYKLGLEIDWAQTLTI